MIRSRSNQIAFATASTIFVVDRGLKWAVESSVAFGKSIPLIPGVVGLTQTNNPGRHGPGTLPLQSGSRSELETLLVT